MSARSIRSQRPAEHIILLHYHRAEADLSGKLQDLKPFDFAFALLSYCPVPNHDTPSGARPQGYAPGDRSAIEFGKQWLALLEGIGFLGTGMGPQTTALEQPPDTAANCHFHASLEVHSAHVVLPSISYFWGLTTWSLK
jgi:hypothetical protein